MKLINQFFLLSFFIFFIFSSCKKDVPLTDASAKLSFSEEEVLFDTVFTTVGSTTKVFKIFNPHSQLLNISKVFLATGSNSQFRINVDGVSTTSLNNIEIMGGDSLFVFVQVTVNPTGINSPLLIRDSIIFETNGNIQHVKLTAVGQDVYLHKPDHFSTTGFPPYSIITCDDWTNDKPHLIFGYAVVDEGCTLTMLPDTRVYLNNKAVLWVYSGGTLIVSGQYQHEVTFQGARLEADYKEIPGQWGKVWLSSGSKNNVIDWAIIKNGSIGVQADTLGASPNPTLQITNTIIKNMSAAAIYGQGSFIRGYNCVFANCGQYVAALTIGGKYKFEQCTFANFWSSGSQRTTPSIALSNYYVDINGNTQIRDLDSAYFGNCIMYGNLDEEVGLDSSTSGGNFSYKFDHCLVKTALNTTNSVHYNTVTVYQNIDPQFIDASLNNYQLKATSPAIDGGDTGIFIVKDLNNKDRPNPNTSMPDLGAYEFY